MFNHHHNHMHQQQIHQQMQQQHWNIQQVQQDLLDHMSVSQENQRLFQAEVDRHLQWFHRLLDWLSR